MIRIENCDMSEHTSFRCGGRAAIYLEPETLEELKEAVEAANRESRAFIFMGNGSNMLFAEEGYDGWVISLRGLKDLVLMADSGAEEDQGYGYIGADAGCSLSAIAKLALANRLAGFEFASGIPGSLGGAVLMNAGAYGGEMKDVLVSVRTMDIFGRIRDWKAEELELSYRHSCFMDDRTQIIISAVIRLPRGDRADIEAKMKDLAERRREKQPLQYPSAGSFFKRPEGHFAGKLIEDAGLKGLQIGGAQVSDLHAGFIINKDRATATDVIELMHVVQETVLDRFGVRLEPEVQIIRLPEKEEN
jgi:UDP-N-acetylmuramate dehydrogenase